MSDQLAQMPPPPPAGDSRKAEKYISQIIRLIEKDGIEVHHTDLSKYDPSSLEDHYRMDLKNYHIEVSHSKQPNTGKDSFILLFNNLKHIKEGCSEKVILAYMHLEESQFKRIKAAAEEQDARKKRVAEEARLNHALKPIDDVIEEVLGQAQKGD